MKSSELFKETATGLFGSVQSVWSRNVALRVFTVVVEAGFDRGCSHPSAAISLPTADSCPLEIFEVPFDCAGSQTGGLDRVLSSTALSLCCTFSELVDLKLPFRSRCRRSEPFYFDAHDTLWHGGDLWRALISWQVQ